MQKVSGKRKHADSGGGGGGGGGGRETIGRPAKRPTNSTTTPPRDCLYECPHDEKATAKEIEVVTALLPDIASIAARLAKSVCSGYVNDKDDKRDCKGMDHELCGSCVVHCKCMRCAKCSAPMQLMNSRTTEKLFVPQQDEFGRVHMHDGNRTTHTYWCKPCSLSFLYAEKKEPCHIGDCIWGRDVGKVYTLSACHDLSFVAAGGGDDDDDL
jgi:hypothetical protein